MSAALRCLLYLHLNFESATGNAERKTGGRNLCQFRQEDSSLHNVGKTELSGRLPQFYPNRGVLRVRPRGSNRTAPSFRGGDKY